MKRIRTEFDRDHSVWWQVKLSTHHRITQLVVDIECHPNVRCIRVPAVYRTFLQQQPEAQARQSHIEANKRKIAALTDVISFLNSLSIGVIR